ncbi:amino acid adenylation domain-containing protein [Streptosporangium becharense]|uniref:Amino acid adenylation domain-containing protein n=1 Tax=Streptosporangium becharense TaxID=1816182 RepID=A0A7W9MEA5_9ACTN|nr:non-ribosomal peptide synthetase [Streptosporangium becharense]MBB2914097.1 amino acid adenylation domain-containing protein [Streptosporangium becharense]MBB5817124.1 amino acid adenylation domain-containing protein [Streptosporangium becharense]
MRRDLPDFPTAADATTLAELLRWRARRQPERVGFVFLGEHPGGERPVTYAHLDRRARAIAGELRRAGVGPADRVLLLYPPGEDFLTSFLGCMYAGAVAVPTFPPDPLRLDRTLPRLLTIVADARPAALLTVAALLPLAGDLPLGDLAWIATDTAPDDEGEWAGPGADASALALLQYTSGSTAEPKGVMLTHGNLLHNSGLVQELFGTDAAMRGLSWLPPYHDMGLIGGLLQPLFAGFPMWLMSPVDFLRRPASWLEAMSRLELTLSGGPNFAYDLCVRKTTPEQREQLDLSAWRVAFNGAEPIRRATLARFAEAFAPAGFRPEAFFPCYGLAEATLIVSGGFAPVSGEGSGEGPVGCGRGGAGQEVRIVDPVTARPCPAGHEGEVWLRGPSVAGGYWNRPEENREVFQAELADGGGPYLRTGDLGRLAGGELTITGRLKDLIIVRGRNHYPQDLEATAERAHPLLRPGCGAAFTVEHDEPAIVHEIVRDAGDVDVAEVARAIRTLVAGEHGLHIGLVVLIPAGCLPKTTSGKVRRRVCRDLLLAGELPEIGRSSADMETYLREQAAAVCGLPASDIARELPLLALGMDSLAAQELTQRVQAELGVRLPLGDLLGGASLADVASLVTDLPLPEPAGGPVAGGDSGAPATPRMSQGQRDLWLLHRLEPESTAYTTAAAFRLDGLLDAEALRRAHDRLLRRHPALRTVFAERDGEPVPVVRPAAPESFSVSELGEAELEARIEADANRPFDLACGPPARLHLYRLTDDTHVLLFAAHHIVTDFWSTMVLGRELEALYGEETGGPAAGLPALDAGPAGVPSRREEQAGRGDRPSLSGPGGTRRFRIGAPLTAGLVRRAAAEGVTPSVFLLAAHQALLHRLTGQDDLAVGVPFAARTQPHLAGVVGHFMNPVPIRSHARDTFRELLAQTRTQVIGALERQEHRDAARFRTMFVFNQPTAADVTAFPALLLGHAGVRRPFGGLRAESLPVSLGECAMDLELSLTALDGDIHGCLRFRTDAFDEDAADRFVRHFTALLEAVVAEPGAALGSVPRAGAEERTLLLGGWSTGGPAPEAELPVSRLVEEQTLRSPHATAIVAGGESLSYLELDQHANRLAHLLRAKGVGSRGRVGICLERGSGMVVAMLASGRAGAAYVPIDPLSPADRVAAVFADAGVDAVVSQEALADKLRGVTAPLVLLDADRPEILNRPVTALPPPALDDPAYVVYTSGTSGTPKGVEVPHRALSAFTRQAAELYGIGPDDRVLQFASIGFDASVEEIYPTLTRGARLVLRTDRMLADPGTFLAACAAQGVTVLDLPTAFWHELVDALDTPDTPETPETPETLPATVRLVIIGGEKALPERVAAWHATVGGRVRLVNTYGPTEATVVATAHELDRPGREVPIGRPLAGVRAYVLDTACRPVPAGLTGELYLGGAGLAHGYLNRPGLTAERFVADPFGPPGGRLYRTGDLVRHLSDGTLVFVARSDRQIKLSGYRVEPGEVEAALRGLDGVTDAAVVRDGKSLLAYVVPETCVADELRTALHAVLPGYMVPARYVPLPALPRTLNGKIDLSALPRVTAPRRPSVQEPFRTPQERALAEIWREVLDVEEVGRTDDFFAVGGHSLSATKMLARVNDVLGRDLPLRAVFETPVLADLADRIRHAPQALSRRVPPAPRDRPLPLSFVQERIWFLQQLDPESTTYNVPRALRLRGRLDVAAIARTLDDLEVRHEILRTTFPEVDGEPFQEIGEPRGIPLTVVDGSEDLLQEFILTAGQEPFDLAKGPLLRVTLVRLAADDHVLVVVEHHMVHDGWAQGVFLRDFLELYEAHATGRPPRLPELPVQYADFAAWQRRTFQGERLRSLLDFWRERLRGAPPLLSVPGDRPRPEVLGSRGGEETLFIEGSLARRLREYGRDHDATLFMTMFAAFALLLRERSGQEDIVVGSGIANRQRPELENLLGMIINTVLLRVDLSGRPGFPEVLDRVREVCLEAYAHQDMPFEKLVESLRPPRSLSHTPLFQVMFNFLDTPMPSLLVPGLDVEVLNAHNRSSKFDLNVVVIPHAGQRLGLVSGPDAPERIAVLLEYNTDLFTAATIRGLLAEYLEILTESVEP